MNLDFWTMFWAMLPALLTAALIQEFIIKPLVGFLRSSYHKSKKVIKDQVDRWPYNEK